MRLLAFLSVIALGSLQRGDQAERLSAERSVTTHVVAELLAVDALQDRPNQFGYSIIPTGFNDVVLETTKLGSANIVVYRASLSNVSHSRLMLAAVDGTEVVELGGFRSPQVIAIARKLGIRVGKGCNSDALSALATLSDPNGGGSIRTLGGWRELEPSRTVPGIHICKVRTISSNSSYAEEADTLTHAFAFDTNNALIGWASNLSRK